MENYTSMESDQMKFLTFLTFPPFVSQKYHSCNDGEN